MKAYGYGGKILRIDLTRREFHTDKLERSWIKTVVGGKAANMRRLAEELDLSCDALSPQNIIILGIGPLSGTLLPASGNFTMSAKSPLTGLATHATGYGRFGAEMKLTGFDQIIIKGAAKKPVYLLIGESGVTFCDARGLVGKTESDTAREIVREHRDPCIQVAAAAAAGDNRVWFSTVVSNGCPLRDGAGLGAVMGSKNLKALAVRSNLAVRFMDPGSFNEICLSLRRKIAESGGADAADFIGTPPRRIFRVKYNSCFNCNAPCRGYYLGGGAEGEVPEPGILSSWLTLLGENDGVTALELYRRAIHLGLDPQETGEMAAWLAKGFKQGWLAPPDVAGFDLDSPAGERGKWQELLECLARRVGPGEILAEGINRFLRSLAGRTSAIPPHEPSGPFGIRDSANSWGEQSEGEKLTAKKNLLGESLAICSKIPRRPGILDFQLASALLYSGTGMDYSPEYLDKIMGEALEREYRFNFRGVP